MIYDKNKIIELLKSDKCSKIYENYGINSVIIFGSIVTDDFEEYSDVDIAVLSSHKIGLSAIMDIEDSISNLINRDVDVVFLNGEDTDLRFKVTVYDSGILIYNDKNDVFTKDYNKTDIIYKNNEEFRYFRERDVIE